MNKKAEQFLLKVVSGNYENIAFDFNKSRQRPMKPMVHEITKNLNLQPGSRVLDLGCGNGCFLPALSLYYKDFFYLGIDGSAKLIEHARQQQKNNFTVLDILDLDKLSENNFDIIFSWAVFHHIPGSNLRLKTLKQIYDKLNGEGKFVFSVWKLSNKKYSFLPNFFGQLLHGRVIDWGDFIFPWKGQAQNDDNRKRYYHNFSKNELKKLIEKTSFKIEEIQEDEFNYYYILKK